MFMTYSKSTTASIFFKEKKIKGITKRQVTLKRLTYVPVKIYKVMLEAFIIVYRIYSLIK